MQSAKTDLLVYTFSRAGPARGILMGILGLSVKKLINFYRQVQIGMATKPIRIYLESRGKIIARRLDVCAQKTETGFFEKRRLSSTKPSLVKTH